LLYNIRSTLAESASGACKWDRDGDIEVIVWDPLFHGKVGSAVYKLEVQFVVICYGDGLLCKSSEWRCEDGESEWG